MDLFLATLPLSLAASVSITSFLMFFATLLAPENQLRNGLTFIVGGFVANAGLALTILFSFGHAAPASAPQHDVIHASINFTLAATCLILIILSIVKKDEPEKKKEVKLPGGVFAYMATGALMRLVSANTVPPFIDAIKDVSRAHLAVISSAILCTLIIIVTMSPLIAIWLIFLLNKEKAIALINPIGEFLVRNKKIISNITLILIAIYLIFLGFKHLGVL